jgi:hypothetical protein
MLLIQLNVKTFFTCLYKMMIKYCEDHTIFDMAYLDPTMVIEVLVTKKPEEMENYIVDFFLEH